MRQLHQLNFSQMSHTSEDNQSRSKKESPMNIAIFGASGATGTLLTERCLAAGHNVNALLRTPEKFPQRDRVRGIQGSPFDVAPVRQSTHGADDVIHACVPTPL